MSVGGTLTYQDVTNIDSVGMVTARKGIQVLADGLTVVGIVTASNGISVGAGQSIGSNGSAVVYYGDGSNLEGVVSGVEVESSGSSVGTSLTALNFVGATVEGDSSVGIATITIASAGIETASQTVSNDVVILNLNSAQDHKVTATGICTITVQGGSEGESHTVRLVNSGVSTVGLSTYFLFPGGAGPSLPTADGSISLISFTVNRVGTAGTQLLTGASVNYS